MIHPVIRWILLIAIGSLCRHPLLAQQHVFFGERAQEKYVNAIFFDRWGHIYPSVFISDSLLQAANGNLHQVYAINPSLFASVARSEMQSDTVFSIGAAEQLEIALIKRYQRMWSALHDAPVLFAVHGYRKSFQPTATDVSSVADFETLRLRLQQVDTTRHHWVEIYWDGGYDCCFSLRTKQNKVLFQLFEQVYWQSSVVGEKLYAILSGVNQAHQGFIAHSLGVNLLIPTMQAASEHPRSFFILAPATDADQHWNNWSPRAQHQIWLLWNKHDFALRKKDAKLGWFGPGVYRYGETSLGCNHRQAVDRWQSNVRKQAPAVRLNLVDLSESGTIHSLRYYLGDKLVTEQLRLFLHSTFSSRN